MNTADVRDSLGRTGVLFTQHEGDVGHVSDFWRKTILGLCSALEAAPTDVADLLRQERGAHVATKGDLSKVLAEVEATRQDSTSANQAKADAEAARDVALRLLAEAVPRMRTLNNAMSPGWLARAAEILED